MQNVSERFSGVAIRLILLAAAITSLIAGGGDNDHSRYLAAYYTPSGRGFALVLFPADRKNGKVELPLPKLPSSTVNLLSFSADGRSAYLQIPSAAVLNKTDSLFRVDFYPMRMNVVAGSEGLGDIWSVAQSARSPNKLFVSAQGSKFNLCGVYEIDSDVGTHRELRVGGKNCRQLLGNISPDGKRVLNTDRDQNLLSLVDLARGAALPLGAGEGNGRPMGNRLPFLVAGRSPSSRAEILLAE